MYFHVSLLQCVGNPISRVNYSGNRTVHGIFDRTVKKSEKLQNSVQKNRNINKKRKTEMSFTIRAHRT